MRTVVIESPYRGKEHAHTAAHAAYLQSCILDCLRRGEAPFASHALYTSVLSDRDEHERAQGIAAGLAIAERLDATVVYLDHGVSEGMRLGVEAAKAAGRPIWYRYLFVGSTGFDLEAE